MKPKRHCVRCKHLVSTVKTSPYSGYIGVCKKTGRAVKDTLCGCRDKDGKITLYNFNSTQI